MSALVIPTRSDGTPHYSFSCELDGAMYGFEFRWNERAKSWFASLSDADGAPILSGQRVRAGAALFHLAVSTRKPPGFFAVVDTTGQGRHPGLTDLGARVVLYYLPAADVAALGG